jgi:hypothetical protein
MFVKVFVCKSEEVEFIKGNLNNIVLLCVLKFLTSGRPPNSSTVAYCGCLFEDPVLNSKDLFQEATSPVMTWPWVLIFVIGMELWDLVNKCGCSKVERKSRTSCIQPNSILFTCMTYFVSLC